ncbi:MAG: hypothetical protein AW10_02231 [Candidatus Accumulibacter appositus]|uniref:Uncharacterized protein n=1 Tax=Candidatus Accumulibacter appositus TaxID=1454003 RepID=A0A011NWL0_9PROT|nr:hypothetical protein [Accumulibacter sp.]EXI79746.1 MAG: hypothetical protein AW10_02231 [Candidatus Accumulibacter appositus]HRF05196.1 hypothetical protein [Accumulibacter sp.]
MNDLSTPADSPTIRTPGGHALRPSPQSNDDPLRCFSPFLPLLLVVLAVFLWTGFQCYQLFGERQSLLTAHANQQRPLDESAKLRASLDTLARETALLADQGNASARLIVEELRKRGVTINPNAAPASKGGVDKQ